ncbi:MAG: DUF11 domain-containing protein [Chloroflexi bacterium]|nr:DUF11 domain-containing protein [Chloroflexota bacterium]
MSRCSSFSLIAIISLLLGLWGSATMLAQAAPEPTAGDLPEIANKLNVVKSMKTISLATVSADVIGAAASSACDTFYFRRDTVDVGGGLLGDGVRKIANTTLPTADAPAVTNKSLAPLIFTEIDRFYSDPPLAANLSLSGSMTGLFWLQTNNLNVTFRVEMFDYNPANNAKTSLGPVYDFALVSNDVNQPEFNITPAVSSIPVGHRLLIMISGKPDLLESATVNLLYDSPSNASQFTVCRPAPNLTITKSGPAFAITGQPIDYTLTVANSGTISATNLVISDTIPSGANYVSGGIKIGNGVRWTSVSLAPSASLQFTFTVTAVTTISNSDYSVVADNNPLVPGQPPVMTLVSNEAPKLSYLPIVSKTGPLTQLIVQSDNTGGINSVRILSPSNQELLNCGPIGNNVTQACGSFPAIGTYRIVAQTNNCGVLQGTFNDAVAGATVTRRVFCN